MPKRRIKGNLRILYRRPGVFLRAYRWPLAILLIGATLDGYTSIRMLCCYGVDVEMHLPMRIVSWIVGPVAGIVIGKVVQVAFAVAVASLWRRWCAGLMTLAGALYLAAAAANHWQLL